MTTQRSHAAVLFVLILAAPHLSPTSSRCQEPSTPGTASHLKAIEQMRLLEGARQRLSQLQAREGRGSIAADESGSPPGSVGTTAKPVRIAGGYQNVLVNNRATDIGTGSGQCEVSIAALGNNLVAAWNDGEGFVTALSTVGFGYSTNGGLSWVDGGVPPTTNVGLWTANPVMTVDEKTGAFYLAGLCEPTVSTNGIGVVRGTFSGGVFTWGTPELVISGNFSSVIYDKGWLAADSTTGNLYLTYSRFTVSGGLITTNRIDFQRKVGLNPFSAPISISSPGDNGRVQGARVAVGPAGEVWAVWNAIGIGIAGGAPTDEDHMRVRRSTDGGVTFGAQVTAVSEYTNFGSGAPGFNSGFGFAFPGIAVDRTGGPYHGRAYLSWNESINFFNDPVGFAGTTNEVEPNDIPASGTPFTMGRRLAGSISGTSDFDYWQFNGTAGQTIICELDASGSSLDAALRLFCSDGFTRLAFSASGPGGFTLVVFTLPASGLYTLRVASLSGTGSYAIHTGLNGTVTERARDHRDVFVSYSDNATTWSTPTRVNDDPGVFDDWLPEVAVADIGRPYVIWYDWRDAPASTCGGVSHVYLSRSDDGGVSWSSMGPITDVQTAWTSVASNIAPNQGRYIGLFGNEAGAHASWSDGRFGDPDVFYAVPLPTPALVSVAGTEIGHGWVRITWYAAEANGFSATVYRRGEGDEWASVGRVSPDGNGAMAFEDQAVSAGATYHYRLGVFENGLESFMGEVTVTIPAPGGLAIETVRPNPADREMWVSFSLPLPDAGSLELIDVSGRRVLEQTVSGIGRQTLDLVAGVRLAPGVYVLRLTQAGRSTVQRVTVVR